MGRIRCVQCSSTPTTTPAGVGCTMRLQHRRPPREQQDDKLDCVCKGNCPLRPPGPSPSPSPPGPPTPPSPPGPPGPPKPPKVPTCYKSQKCMVDPAAGFEPFAVKKKQTETESCSACAAALCLVNSSSTHGGPGGCAPAVLLPDLESPADKSGSCALYTLTML